MNLPKDILDFLASEHIFNLAVCTKDGAYAASCFYVFSPKDASLIFASDPRSMHIRASDEFNKVAASITLNTSDISSIKGVQITGIIKSASKPQRLLYAKHYPIVLAMKAQIYSLEMSWIKFTNNTLGFGNKSVWTRNANIK